MKIAIWNTNYFKSFGGTEKVVNNLLNCFGELGIKTILIANKFEKKQRGNEFFEPLYNNVKVYQNTFTNPWDCLHNPFVFLVKILRYCKAATQLFFFLRNKKDYIIHLHYVS